MPQNDILDVLLRGVAVGGFAATGLGLAVGGRLTPARWLGAAFFASAIGHTLDNSAAFRTLPLGVVVPAHLMSVAGGGLFWAFALALFTDEPRPPWRRLLPTALILAATQLCLLFPAPAHRLVLMLTALFSAALVAHALLVIWRDRGGDLVDTRRRLRAPVMAVAAAYVLVIALGDMGQAFGLDILPHTLVQAVVLALLSVIAAQILLRPDPSLMAPPAQQTAPAVEAVHAQPAGLDPGDRVTLERLSRAMDVDEVWRRESLSVGGLAAMVGAPEHRLRRLINGQLGHRNFAAFVNARRIAAARAELSDPQSWRKPVSSIAYDLGFGSLGPFNRAFKDATGMTPSAWRQARGAEGLPISEQAA